LLSGTLINEEPTTFDQAWNHKVPKIREKWWAARNEKCGGAQES
jgi:hypothetical protein